jgi:DNA polymerase-3 subunit gamma/tau
LTLIARAAEGSVRDSLSLLDQAIAISEGGIEADLVQAMLGLGDRLQLLELTAAVLQGAAGEVLDRFAALYALGADPGAIVQDLLEVAHWLSRLKVKPDAASSLGLAAQVAERAQALAAATSLPVLARAWQMLLKGVDEVRSAPDAAAAAEMLLLRLACVSELPPPSELARLLRDGQMPTSAPARFQPASQPRPGPPAPVAVGAERLAPAPQAAPVGPRSFADLVDDLRRGGEAPLAAWLYQSAHVIRFEPGRLELRLANGAPSDLLSRLGEAAARVTGRRWLVALGGDPGEPTLAQQDTARKDARLTELRDWPEIQQVLEAFPGAHLHDVRPRSD